MSTKRKADPWQIISAILAAITSVLSSLKKSHDDAHQEQYTTKAPADGEGFVC